MFFVFEVNKGFYRIDIENLNMNEFILILILLYIWLCDMKN